MDRPTEIETVDTYSYAEDCGLPRVYTVLRTLDASTRYNDWGMSGTDFGRLPEPSYSYVQQAESYTDMGNDSGMSSTDFGRLPESSYTDVQQPESYTDVQQPESYTDMGQSPVVSDAQIEDSPISDAEITTIRLNNKKIVIRYGRSQRNQEVLIIDDYIYNLQSVLKTTGEKKWSCKRKKCPSRVYIKSSSDVARGQLVHNHTADWRRTRRRLLTEEARAEVSRTDPSSVRTPSHILNAVKSRLGELAQSLNSVDEIRCKRNVYNSTRKTKNETVPNETVSNETMSNETVPSSSNEASGETFDVENVCSDGGERFKLYSDPYRNLTVYATESDLRDLFRSELVYACSAYQYRPEHCGELFTLMGVVDDEFRPLAYCLLPDRTTESYAIALRAIAEKLESFPVRKPNSRAIIVDGLCRSPLFEAVRNVWPPDGLTVECCRNHVTRQWAQKIADYQMIDDCVNGTVIGKQIDLLFALPLVEFEKVREAFKFIIVYHPKARRFAEFREYMEENYILESAQNPPVTWAYNSAAPSTTPDVGRAFRERLASLFSSRRPTLMHFVQKIMECQASFRRPRPEVSNEKVLYERENLKSIKLLKDKCKHDDNPTNYLMEACSFYKPNYSDLAFATQ